MNITIEELDKVLTHPNIEGVTPVGHGTSTFQRMRLFTIKGTEYAIEWWSNGCYLYQGDLTIPFQTVRQSGTWPNSCKLNLQFYNADGSVCCIIAGLEEYEGDRQNAAKEGI